MTSIKVSQLPEVAILSLGDELIINDSDKTPTVTSKTSLNNVFVFAEQYLTFKTNQILLTNQQNDPNYRVPGRPELGAPPNSRNIVSGVLPPIGSLTTQEDYNIWLVNAAVLLDQEIDRIELDGTGVTNIKAGPGLQTTPAGGISSTGSIGVDATVMLTDADQVVSGQKTFTVSTTFNGRVLAQAQLNVTGVGTFSDNIDCTKTVTAAFFVGDGSQLKNLPAGTGTVASVTAGDGIKEGAASSGSTNSNAITTTGTLSVDESVVRTTGAQSLGGSLTVEGNITSTSGIFIGDGSGLSGITAVAGPFTFQGQVDVVNGNPPTDPAPADGFIYFNTVAGDAKSTWTGISGQAVGLDQMIVYSGSLSGWVIGSAVDRGTFLPVDGGTISGALTVSGASTLASLTVNGTSQLTGVVTSSAGITGDLTGNVTGNVTGNADTATLATNATNAVTATNADNVKLSLNTVNAANYIPYANVDATYDALGYNTNLTYNPNTETLGTSKASITTLSAGTIGATGTSSLKDVSATTIAGTSITASTAIIAPSATLTDITSSGNTNLDTLRVSTKTTTDDLGATTATIETLTNTTLNAGTIDASGDISTDGVFNGDASGLFNVPGAESAGTITKLTEGIGIALTPSSITTEGTIAIDNTVVTTAGGQTIDETTTLNQVIVKDGGIVSSGKIQVIDGGFFSGDGSGLTGVPSTTGGTVTKVTGATNGGITTSPSTGITDSGELSVDSSVVRTSGAQQIDGAKTFGALGTFQAGLNVTGTVNATSYEGDGSQLKGVSNNAGTVTEVDAGNGLTSNPTDGITGTGSLAVDDTKVAMLTGNQTLGGVKTFSAEPAFLSGIDVTGDGDFSGTVTAKSFIGDGSQLDGIKAGMFRFGGTCNCQGNPPTSVGEDPLTAGDVFMNTTAGVVNNALWVGIDGTYVAANQLVIYSLGGSNINAWVRGAIADTGQFLSTAVGGTVQGPVVVDASLQVNDGITGNLTGTASTATNCSRNVTAGDGLTGGGALTSNVTLTVEADGNTISVGADGISVLGENVTAGNATKATTADSATKVNLTQGNLDGTFFLAGASGSAMVDLVSTSGIYMNCSTNTITAGEFDGGGADITEVVHTSGAEQVGGVKTFTSFPQVPAGDGANPALPQDVASKQYVDAQVIAAGSGTVVSITPGTGLSSSTGGAITESGTLNVDASEVMFIDGTQTITGTKTFSPDTYFSNDIDVTGDVKANSFEGDGSNLTGVSNNQGTVQSIFPGAGISVGGADITVTGTISVDSTVLRTTGAQAIDNGGSLTVGGNIEATNGGIFTGDGSGLSNLPIALGPFSFKGTVDVTTDGVPTLLANGDVYINTTAGTAVTEWIGIDGQTIAEDQIVVYQTATTPHGWLAGSALDRGQFVPTSGGTFTGGVTLADTLNVTNATALAGTLGVTGASTLTGLVSGAAGFKCTGGVFTGNLVGNATTATSATSADTATNATNATTAATATVANTVKVVDASDDVDYFLTFAQTGDSPLKSNSKIAFNPTDDILELSAKLESTKNIKTTNKVIANQLEGDGASVINVDALTCKKSVTGGSGLTGGGVLSANRSISVGTGNGITVNTDSIEVKAKPLGGITVDSTGVSINTSELPATCEISTTAPTNASAGDLWWNSENGEMYIYYSDAGNSEGGTVSSQWVQSTPNMTTQAAQITALQGQVNSLLARLTAAGIA